MKVTNSLVVTIAVLLSLAFLLALYQLLGLTGVILGLIAVAVLLGAGIFWGRSRVMIGELEVGVVFKQNGNFSRFIDSGYQNINPFWERLEGKISKGSQKAVGNCHMMRTADGMAVSADWAVSFKVDPFEIGAGARPSLSRALPANAPKIVGGKASHAFRHLVEQKTLADLCSKGALKTLEEELAKDLSSRVAGIGVMAIPARDVQLGPFYFQDQLERTFTSIQERTLHTGAGGGWAMRMEKPN